MAMTDTPPIQLTLEPDLQALRSLPLLRALPNRPLAALQKTARIVHFGSGEVMFRANEPLDELHFLMRGEVAATRPRLEDKEDIVDVLLPVRPLCLPAVLLGLTAPIGARTLTAGHLIALPASQLREMIASDPRLMRSVFDDVVRDAHELAVEHYIVKMRSIVQRLAGYLFNLIEDPDEKPARFILPYKTELLAARFGATLSGVANAFDSLRTIGVQKQNRAVVVQDAAALKVFANSPGQPSKRRPNAGRRRLEIIDGGKSPPRKKKPGPVPGPKRLCKVLDCGKPVHARGYCLTHYRMTRPTCKVAGCTKPSHAHGYCSTHYLRLKRHGDPTKVVQTGME
jgi:CRP-like cAMP-binding protein